MVLFQCWLQGKRFLVLSPMMTWGWRLGLLSLDYICLIFHFGSFCLLNPGSSHSLGQAPLPCDPGWTRVRWSTHSSPWDSRCHGIFCRLVGFGATLIDGLYFQYIWHGTIAATVIEINFQAVWSLLPHHSGNMSTMFASAEITSLFQCFIWRPWYDEHFFKIFYLIFNPLIRNNKELLLLEYPQVHSHIFYGYFCLIYLLHWQN